MAKVKGIKIGNYSVTLSSTGIVAADGTSGRHLTACYNFRTNSIDIHVTDEGTKEKIVRIHFNIFDVFSEPHIQS
jgi:hypothetical protein